MQHPLHPMLPMCHTLARYRHEGYDIILQVIFAHLPSCMSNCIRSYIGHCIGSFQEVSIEDGHADLTLAVDVLWHIWDV